MAPARPETARQASGRRGEQAARALLERRGLRCVAANWRCRGGELDLVMLDGDILVFVEVRARRPANLVSPFESVDAAKRRKLVRAARLWLAMHPAHAHRPARFDIVAVTLADTPPAADACEWLQNAFDVAAN